jgi:hypothetical protein
MGGVRVRGTVTSGRPASVLANGVRIVGSRMGAPGHMGVAGLIGLV